MTAVVHKHPIMGDDVQIDLISGAQIIHVGPDPTGLFCLWETHEETARRVYSGRRFRLVGTGHPIAERIVQHLGSHVTGPLVLHLFEVEP